MSVIDMEHLLHNIYERQAHLLKALEERYTGRPIYEEPLDFDTERGEIQKGGNKKKSQLNEILPSLPIHMKPIRTSKESHLSLEEQENKIHKKEQLKRKQELLENELKEKVKGKGSEVKMPKKDYMAEHYSLIKMLENISSKASKEAKKQSKEIKGKGDEDPINVIHITKSKIDKKTTDPQDFKVLRKMEEHQRYVKSRKAITTPTGIAFPPMQVRKGKGKKCVNNIKGGCGECDGTNGELII